MKGVDINWNVSPASSPVTVLGHGGYSRQSGDRKNDLSRFR